MSSNLGESNVDGHPETAAYMVARNSAGAFVFVQGVTDGDFAALKVVLAGGLGGGRKITVKTNVAVVNGTGNTVDFELTVDADGDVLPSDMEIQAIIIQPHDGVSPPAVVSTKWIFKLYTHSDREVDDIFFGTDRTERDATDAEFVLNSKMGYVNEEGATNLPCSLTIAGGENDATFTVKVIFA